MGSEMCIRDRVHHEAEESYQRIIGRCEEMIAGSLARIAGNGAATMAQADSRRVDGGTSADSVGVLLANPAPHVRSGVQVVDWPDDVTVPALAQGLADGRVAVEADLPAGGWALAPAASDVEVAAPATGPGSGATGADGSSGDPVAVSLTAAADGGGVMTNGLLTLSWDLSLIHI